MDLDADGFEAVYRAHADAVYRFCLSQLRDPAEAEDLAADVFAAACAAFVRAPLAAEAMRPWLFRIARNAVIDRSRRLRRRGRILDRFRPAPEAADVEAAAELRGDLRAAAAAISRLRLRDRQLVGLRVAAGLSFTDIGAVLGMSPDAARMATQRALLRVRREVQR